MKYYRYQLVYPFESDIIYKSSSLKKIVDKCYKDIIKLNKNYDTFHIMNLDKGIVYKFTKDKDTENKLFDIYDNWDISFLQKMKNEENNSPFKWII